MWYNLFNHTLGGDIMTIITKNRTYTFSITENSKFLRVTGGPKELFVTDITSIFVGENMIIRGYLVNPENNTPMTRLGTFHFTTAPVVKILP